MGQLFFWAYLDTTLCLADHGFCIERQIHRYGLILLCLLYVL